MNVRLHEVTKERDKSNEDCLLLQTRIFETHELIRVASQQQTDWQQESEKIIWQLEVEN